MQKTTRKWLVTLVLVAALTLCIIPVAWAAGESPPGEEAAEPSIPASETEASDETAESEPGTITDTGGNFLESAGMDGISLLSSGPTLSQGEMLWTQNGMVQLDYTDTQGTHHCAGYTWLAPYYLGGKPAFCIQPTVHVVSGMSYSQAQVDEAWENQLTEDQRQAIALAIAYGYPNCSYATASQDGNTAGIIESEKLLATQTIVWEIVTGQRSAQAPYPCDSSTITSAFLRSWYPTYFQVYEEIAAAMAAHLDIPSFSSWDPDTAPTWELVYDDDTGNYRAELTDTAGVLEAYSFSSDLPGLTISQSGNTLTLEASEAAAETLAQGITTSAVGKSLQVNPSIITIWAAEGYQSLGQLSVSPEPVTAYLHLSCQLRPQAGNLVVTKAVNYGTWEGFSFRLYGTSDKGNPVDVTATTDEDGKAYFYNVEIGTYTLEEINPRTAYVLPQPQTVTILGDETIDVTMENLWKHWQAEVTKVDWETGTAQGDASLNGAEYTLYKSGEAIATYTISNGKFTTDFFPCTRDDGVYTLQETKAPAGYLLDETVYKLQTSYDHYSQAENRFTVTVSDQVIRGQIQLEKWAVNTVSGEKQPEQGATFAVWLQSADSYDSAKESERDIITIGEDGKGISKSLPYGTYCVQQRTGWAGYDRDETIYGVTISEDGQTVKKDNAGHDLVIYNNIWTGTLSICKVDGADNTPLAGAVFTLTGSDGSESTLTTGEDGIVTFENLVFGITYVWKEIQAPKGYLLSEDNTGIWSVEEPDAEIQITAEDSRRPGSITVTKENTDGDPLFGCTFLLEYLDGDAWKPVFQSEELAVGGCSSQDLTDGCLTTDESGTVTFSGLWADGAVQYRLTEIQAPEGYKLLKEPVYEGTLPITADPDEIALEPEEVLDGTAYFYNLSITVQNGHIYTLPMTGGSGVPFAGIGAVALFLGLLLFVNIKYPFILKNLKRRILHEN